MGKSVVEALNACLKFILSAIMICVLYVAMAVIFGPFLIYEKITGKKYDGH